MKIKPPLPTVTRAHARALRRHMTDAERALWRRLRSNQLQGFKFRRQHPIPPYIADFCCIEAKVIVELDGSQHQAPFDQARTRWLQSKGWIVLCFWNNDVLLSLDAVVEAIFTIVATPYPHPKPSPGGRGA
ncbi:endonuclease domain-containing protein [Xanthomonas euvesicatoria pv. eucalypti]|uniref:endonuclease domain-containing protein n=1 Tax=Xanthomonas euvesicatoria TaxID=456327 RepID=UPI0026E463E4|nr:endonuclease domain-containing protein [Xanthomonas euvesicatoria]MDO7932999.1 endonuclease domain-containing protein [Xanthomonas euvesicatoria pv. eucalypti]MDO7936293.1 endonuclease domain-containing protein [Xanthomonas euvesicatoria pv. eucalypti]MDO7941626.1 endonuclease domain-containing protein [Xanthomonas euvesicatoria pv. eucalypti]MDO7946748.1 endonuclease domain-containing protein [Xanthomonas euvesicatoria pv. eucalypti]MDO7948157.1 endonuclease domain-containing protein [Xant